MNYAPRLARIAAFLLTASTALLSPHSAFAASGTWNGTTDDNWSSTTNWSVNPAPGSTSVTTNTDIATFNNAGNGNTTLTIDANRNLRTLNFDTSTVSYTIGSAGANGGNALRLTTSGAISLLATASGTNLIQTFNAPLTLYGSATFTNARADAGSALVFAGNITNAATSTLTLAGAGTGTGNLISGNITDGTGVQSLSNTSTAGKWTLGGVNNYSGLTNITGAGSTTVMQGSNSSAGATTLNNATATLQLNNASNGGLASGLLTLTAGKLEALNLTRSLSNAVTLAAVTVQGDQSINFDGKLTGLTGGARTLTNNLAVGKTLTLSTVDINTQASTAYTLTIAGTGNTTVSGTIANGVGTTTDNGLSITSAGTTTLSGGNSYSGATSMNSAAGVLVMSGSNSSLVGTTTLTTGTLQLNSASNGGLAGGLLTLTAGKLEALNATRSLSNAISLGGSLVTISGDQSINFNGKLTGPSSRTLTNNLTAGKVLTLSAVDINADGSNNRVLTIAGTGDTTITGTIANGTTTGHGIAINSTGTTTLKGAGSYNGATAINGGTTILDGLGSSASLNSVSTMIFSGGTFVFKGDNSGTAQTVGNVTFNYAGSVMKVVAGTAGTTLNLGTLTGNNEAPVLNITLDNTNGTAGVTTTTGTANGLLGSNSPTNTRITVTSISSLGVTTTEFATKTGSAITQYTGQTAFIGTGATPLVSYNLTGSAELSGNYSMNSLRLDTSGNGQSLDIKGRALNSPGLLFVGAHAYEIKDSTTGGLLNGSGSNAELNIHNFGLGTLTISAVINNASGNTFVSLDGPGTTLFSGANTYYADTNIGGGATLSISANSGLGSGVRNPTLPTPTAALLNLNNATLRATGTFTLSNFNTPNGVTYNRPITLGANGGTFDVTGSNTLTSPGVASGTGRLTKTGTGTLELSAVNTYSGGTKVNNGTLLVSGTGSINGLSTLPDQGVAITASGAKLKYDSSVALTRNVTVTGGGTFAYNSPANYTGAFTFTNGKLGGTNWNGSLAGLTIGTNQSITPGNSVGAATSTTQTWAGGGSYDFEINQADGTAGLTAGGWDLLTLSGALNITATSGSKFNLNVISLGLDNLAGNATGFVNTNTYAWLLTDTGSSLTSFTGRAFAINTTNFTNANSGTWAVALGDTGGIGGTDQQLYLTYTPSLIPEPSTYAALLGVCGLMLAALRRRRLADA